MRRTITAIIAFSVWILFVGLSLTIMDTSLLLGIFAMAAFTIVILFGYVMINDIMADLDREGRERKYRKELAKIRASQNTIFMGRQPINPTELRIKREKRISLDKLLKFKEKAADFEILAAQSRNINRQSLD